MAWPYLSAGPTPSKICDQVPDPPRSSAYTPLALLGRQVRSDAADERFSLPFSTPPRRGTKLSFVHILLCAGSAEQATPQRTSPPPTRPRVDTKTGTFLPILLRSASLVRWRWRRFRWAIVFTVVAAPVVGQQTGQMVGGGSHRRVVVSQPCGQDTEVVDDLGRRTQNLATHQRVGPVLVGAVALAERLGMASQGLHDHDWVVGIARNLVAHAASVNRRAGARSLTRVERGTGVHQRPQPGLIRYLILYLAPHEPVPARPEHIPAGSEPWCTQEVPASTLLLGTRWCRRTPPYLPDEQVHRHLNG